MKKKALSVEIAYRPTNDSVNYDHKIGSTYLKLDHCSVIRDPNPTRYFGIADKLYTPSHASLKRLVEYCDKHSVRQTAGSSLFFHKLYFEF